MAEKTKAELPEKPEAKRIQVRLPRLSDPNANQTEYFSVNFKGYLIERGKYVDVPEELYEVIRNGELAEDAAFKYVQANALNEAK